MIGPEHVRTMARYNAWQNGQVCAAADALGEAARRADRGAFFGSIHATLSHLLWADHVWMSRLDAWPAPQVGIPGSATWVDDWDALQSRRRDTDAGMLRWADGLGSVEGDLTWWSGAAGREVRRPLWLIVTHVFNHQTHHRGQIHAMLTAAGAAPGDTDLFLMPPE